jgi:hypothetical protein
VLISASIMTKFQSKCLLRFLTLGVNRDPGLRTRVGGFECASSVGRTSLTRQPAPLAGMISFPKQSRSLTCSLDFRATPDYPSRTRTFIAISLGLVPPACDIHSITFERQVMF